MFDNYTTPDYRQAIENSIDTSISAEDAIYKHLDDEEEKPENIHRTAALEALRIISLSIDYILSCENPILASYGVAYALGLDHLTQGKSMRKMGEELGMSHGIIQFHKKRMEKILSIKIK